MNTVIKISVLFVFVFSVLFSSCKNPTDEDERHLKIIDSVVVYLSDLKGENVIKLVDGEDPIFIPNTNKLLYRYYDKIMTFDFDNFTTNFVALAPGIDIHLSYKMSVSPDGTYVIFPGKNKVMDLFIATIDGSKVLNITNTPDRWEDDPIFSPDGNSILFFEFIYESESMYNIIDMGLSKIDILGNRYQRIFNEGYVIISFSHDGQYIIFRSYDSNIGTSIFVNHSNDYSIFRETLLKNEHIFNSPAISNDMYLYFCPNEYNIYRVNLITNEREILYTGFIGRDYSFSHDFKKVIITNGGITLIDLTTGTKESFFTDWECSFRDIVFSPEGNKFIFVKSIHEEIVY